MRASRAADQWWQSGVLAVSPDPGTDDTFVAVQEVREPSGCGRVAE